MKEGRVNSPVSRLYGYGTSDSGELVIVLEQAEIVKQMFNRILAADSLRMIRDALNADSIPARGGNGGKLRFVGLSPMRNIAETY